MKKIIMTLLASNIFFSCASQVDLIDTRAKAPATLQDALNFAKRYEVDFTPDKNFNQDQKLSKQALEQLFVKWSAHQSTLITPEQRAIAQAHNAFYNEVKNVKSKKEYYDILDKHPKVKSELVSQAGSIDRFNDIKTMVLAREQLK